MMQALIRFYLNQLSSTGLMIANGVYEVVAKLFYVVVIVILFQFWFPALSVALACILWLPVVGILNVIDHVDQFPGETGVAAV